MLAKDSFLGSLLVLPMELWNGLMDETTIKYTTPLAKLTRNPEKSLLPTLCDFVTLLSHFGFFSVRLTVSEVFKSFWDCPGVVSTTCCHCDIIWCVRDVILCDSSFESSALRPFAFVTSSPALRSCNRLTIFRSRS